MSTSVGSADNRRLEFFPTALPARHPFAMSQALETMRVMATGGPWPRRTGQLSHAL